MALARRRSVAVGLGVTLLLALGAVLRGGGDELPPLSEPPPLTKQEAGHAHVEAAAAAPAPLVRDPFCAPVDALGAPAACPAAPAPSIPQPVRLVAIFLDGGVPHAKVTVAGAPSVLHQGDSFAGVYQLVSMADGCASFTARGEPFRLCEGQEAVV